MSRTYLTPQERGVVNRLLAGSSLIAMRIFPRDWEWKLKSPVDGEPDLALSEGLVSQLACSGVGLFRSIERRGDYETQEFSVDPEGAQAALARQRPNPHEGQLNWIPEDHPSLRKLNL